MSQRKPTWGPCRSILWIPFPSTKSVRINPQAAWFSPSEKQRTSADSWTPGLPERTCCVELSDWNSGHLICKHKSSLHIREDKNCFFSSSFTAATSYELILNMLTIAVKCCHQSTVSLHNDLVKLTRLSSFILFYFWWENGHLKSNVKKKDYQRLLSLLPDILNC